MEMAAEREEDPFASIIKFCEPTASQEAKFPNCPLARESENFVDSNPDQFSSSPDRSPSEATGIVMITPPGSSSSFHQHMMEEDAVFHTPPEHHSHSHLSSSEDQNPNELRAEGLRISEAGDRSDGTTSVRVSEAGLADEPAAKRVRVVPGEEFDGETVPLGETEVVETEGIRDTEVIDLDSGDSVGEERAASILAEGSTDVAGEGGGEAGSISCSTKDEVTKFVAINGSHVLGGNCGCAEDIGVTRDDKTNEDSDSSGSLDSDRIEGEIAKLKHTVGTRCDEVKLNSDVGVSEEAVKISEEAKMPKDSHRDGGVRSNGKRIEEIEEFRYTGDVNGRCEGGIGRPAGSFGGRRQLPPSLKGKEKDVVENSEKKSGWLDLLDVLKAVFGDTDGGGEDVDYLKTAMRRGFSIPKARWWPSDENEE
ncbi:hypothetical protein C2S51_001609 [Perilla frutescens var. frutescens]|nr:hypothetical protein C2S51_001609 [Perilla frutescens var. frutescens]